METQIVETPQIVEPQIVETQIVETPQIVETWNLLCTQPPIPRRFPRRFPRKFPRFDRSIIPCSFRSLPRGSALCVLSRPSASRTPITSLPRFPRFVPSTSSTPRFSRPTTRISPPSPRFRLPARRRSRNYSPPPRGRRVPRSTSSRG